MDVWAWVEQTTRSLRAEGHGRLAHIIDRLPALVVDQRYGEADALVPEALELVAQSEHPWLEVFVRHWELQGLVLGRCQVREGLPKAVDLIELCSRPAYQGCPQSTCAVQDLASCYGHSDGPGYVDERLQVAEETLARINPEWACFVCLSGEYGEALLDGGRFDEALAFAEQQIRAMAQVRAGQDMQLALARARALIALGRMEEALSTLQPLAAGASGESGEMSLRLARARVMAAVGRMEEAQRLLPAAAELSAPCDYVPWCRAVRALVRAGGRDNDALLGLEMSRMWQRLEEVGALFDAVVVRRLAAELALARGAYAVAQQQVSALDMLYESLRAPEREQAKLARTRTALQLPREHLPLPADDVEALLQQLPESPEAVLEVVVRARARWPDEERLICLKARTLCVLGFALSAERLLREHNTEREPFGLLFYELAAVLLSAKRHDALDALLDGSEKLPPTAQWFRARSLQARDRLPEAAAALRALLADDDHDKVRLRLAQIEREQGDFEAAAEQLRIVTQRSEPGSADWDLMVVATVLERWDEVREAAARVGCELSGQGPVRLEMGPCWLRIEDSGGQPFMALRTGPVTAQIKAIGWPGEKTRYAEQWVFDALDLGDDEDGWPTFQALYRIAEEPHQVFVIDGVHPEPAQLEAIEAALDALSVCLRVRGHEHYRLTDPSSGEELAGLYAVLAVPRRRDLRRVHEVLQTATAELAHPLTWSGLVAEIGDAAELARQRAIEERYGL